MSDIISDPGDLTADQHRTRDFAYRIARAAAGVLYGDENAWGTSPDPRKNADGFTVRLDDDGTVESYWQCAYVRQPGEYINRAEVQAFDADSHGNIIRAKISVGRYPYAAEAYLSFELSDDSLRQIISAMDTVFWVNRNRTTEDRKAAADAEHAENSAPGTLSGAEPSSGYTGNPDASTAPETDA